MEERRKRILDTTERLIRDTGGTEFSVRTIAAAAEVAPATPFNLFGSKEGLLYALLFRSLDAIITEGLSFKSPNRLNHVVEATTSAVNIFVKDPDYMRPLYRVLLGVDDEVHRPDFMNRSLGFWRIAVETLPAGGLLNAPRQKEFATISLQAQFLGLLELWVHHDIDDKQFLDHAIYGVVASLAGLVDQKIRGTLISFLEIAEGSSADAEHIT
ncbi:TetR/AcrR family transcriptional regulator [Sphingobium aromaticiconvertens]|uniref:TetR/AcrR family transcriptional regulator n=1 Tax=Sphingobium aromaticiconvertens TaxID=365341 RepID=UPI003016C6FC